MKNDGATIENSSDQGKILFSQFRCLFSNSIKKIRRIFFLFSIVPSFFGLSAIARLLGSGIESRNFKIGTVHLNVSSGSINRAEKIGTIYSTEFGAVNHFRVSRKVDTGVRLEFEFSVGFVEGLQEIETKYVGVHQSG